jgi:ribosomal protein S18 acetylase RimI-like enzyme
MSANTLITPLTIDAYDEVMALWRQCEGIGLSDADSEASIASYLGRNPGLSFLARVDRTLAGAVLCGHDGRRGYLHHLAVHPRFRRQGIGGQLVRRCLDALRAVGIGKCHLFVLNRNGDGIAFWEAVGWTRRMDIGILSITLGPVADDRCSC